MEPPWLPCEEEEEGMPEEPPPPLDPPLGMLLEEPPEEPPPLEPDEPPEEPEEPPLGMLLEGIEEEEDCCWGHPPMSKAETEPTSTHCTAIVSRRFDVGDRFGSAAWSRVDRLCMSSPSIPLAHMRTHGARRTVRPIS